jgi:hypothetical protein
MKLAFWGLLVAGFAACAAVGIGGTLERAGGNWLSPWMVAGCVLGTALVGLAIAFATGYRPAVLPSDVSMVVALVALLGAKVVVSVAQVAVAALSRV